MNVCDLLAIFNKKENINYENKIADIFIGNPNINCQLNLMKHIIDINDTRNLKSPSCLVKWLLHALKCY